jgi:hypothetical protein
MSATGSNNGVHAATQGSPRAVSMRVVPVAGQDSMLLNLSGAHGPYFTRNVVIIEDETGNVGVGEVPGGEQIKVPTRPGLGIELDVDAVERAHQLYLDQGLGARDDATAMQFLIQGWEFDNKRPALVR